MKYIPLLAMDDANPEIKQAWENYGFDLAIFHVAAHANNTFLRWSAFNRTIWEEEADGFPMPLKEMAVVQASVLSHSSYEWGNHGAQMIKRGASQEQLDTLIAGDPKSDLFNETEKLVLQFTTEVVEDARPSEKTLTAMSVKYSNKQITQLVYAICVYMMNSRLANLGGCEIGDDEDYGMFTLGRKT